MALNEPALNEPALNEPALNEPALNEPALNEPALNEPALNEPALNEPALNEPALFAIEGELFIPSEYTRGPWTADSQHGGPPAALLQRLIEGQVAADFWIARTSVELLAPVPLTPLRPTISCQQLSRRVHLITAGLSAGTNSDGSQRIVARATARALLRTEAPAPEAAQLDIPFLMPGPEADREAPAWLVGETHITFHQRALQHRWESGDFETAGPAICWQRLLLPVVLGEVPSGHQRIMALADIASGVSAVFSTDSGFGMINSDLDVAFVREPVGEWIRTDATTRVGPGGTGICANTLGDPGGVVAHGTQTLLGRPFH